MSSPSTNMKAPNGILSGDGSVQARIHGGAFGDSYPQILFCPQIFLCSEKFVSNI